MAEPARKHPDPVSQAATDEPAAKRLRADNDPRVDHRRIIEQQNGGVGNGVIIAGIALALAMIAYFMFAPGPETTVPAEPPAATAPAPEATAPAAPAPAPAN